MTKTSVHNLCILGSTATKQRFPTPLEQANKMMYRFLLLDPSLTKKEMLKILSTIHKYACT